MDPQPDVIRQQIEETRSSLTDKLETLEAEVKGTVQSAKETVESAKEAVEETLSTAKETVQETISTVKETVQTATETVKRTFDIPYQVDRHPFAMMGLSLLSGVIAGALVGPRLSSGRRMARHMAEASREPPTREGAAPASAWSRLTGGGDPGRPGFVEKLADQLGGEVEKAKDLALKTIVGVVDNAIQRSIPVLGAAVEDMMAKAATNFAPPQQHGEEFREPAAGSGYRTPPMY